MKRWLATALLLSGCAGSPSPPIQHYGLAPALPAPTTRPACAEPLALAKLRGARPYATTRMLYQASDLRQSAFAWSRWRDTPLALLELHLVEGLSRSGPFAAVLPPGSRGRSRLILEGTLLDFSLHTESRPPQGRLESRWLLIDKTKGQVLAGRHFLHQVPVTTASPQSTADALNRATGELIEALGRWLTHQMEGRCTPAPS